MLKCECDRCHTEMKVSLSATPFIMPNLNDTKPDFVIFRYNENDQMEQLHLCPTCERHFELFLNELSGMPVEEK